MENNKKSVHGKASFPVKKTLSVKGNSQKSKTLTASSSSEIAQLIGSSHQGVASSNEGASKRVLCEGKRLIGKTGLLGCKDSVKRTESSRESWEGNKVFEKRTVNKNIKDAKGNRKLVIREKRMSNKRMETATNTSVLKNEGNLNREILASYSKTPIFSSFATSQDKGKKIEQSKENQKKNKAVYYHSSFGKTKTSSLKFSSFKILNEDCSSKAQNISKINNVMNACLFSKKPKKNLKKSKQFKTFQNGDFLDTENSKKETNGTLNNNSRNRSLDNTTIIHSLSSSDIGYVFCKDHEVTESEINGERLEKNLNQLIFSEFPLINDEKPKKLNPSHDKKKSGKFYLNLNPVNPLLSEKKPKIPKTKK